MPFSTMSPALFYIRVGATLMMYLYLAAGLVLLLFGGELLVRGTVALAERIGVSKLVIGLTVVAFGTSAPELVVCLEAALSGAPGIALGNVVGSNIANILLVLGLPAFVMPIVCDTRSVRRDGLFMVFATLFFILLAWTGSIGKLQGVALILLLAGFFSYSYIRGRRVGSQAATAATAATEEVEHHMPHTLWLSLFFISVGFATLIGGSQLLIEGATDIAHVLGLPDTVVGITIIAIGTSLPELATGVIAAMRGHGEVVVGNAIGSNLFNVLGIMGLTAIVIPVPVPDRILHFDLWIMLACAMLLFLFALRNWPIGRTVGIVFLIAYVAYLGAQFYGMSGVNAMTPLAPAG